MLHKHDHDEEVGEVPPLSDCADSCQLRCGLL
jgi:hypothetical protein